MRTLAGMIVLCAGLLCLGPPAGAQATDPQSERVDLALVLAVDISLSMDHEEQRLQRDGYVAAFRHGEVIAAIRSAGGFGRIAVAYVEWAGAGSARVVVPWSLIDGAPAAEAFAAHLEASSPRQATRTAIGEAIIFSAALFAASPYAAQRRVIDVSGDGPNNQGVAVTQARDAAVDQGVVINGLPIMLREGDPIGLSNPGDLAIYYEDCVIGGTGAFVVPVLDKSEFTEAIRRKLVLEIAGNEPESGPGFVPASLAAQAPRIDCAIGERLWRQFRDGRW